jgi:hypothetical protein
MEIKPTNTFKHLKVFYVYHKHIKHPTCSRFGHSNGHPQGGLIESIYYKNFKIQSTDTEY